MGDFLYYISLTAILLGIPALVIFTVVAMAKPHIVNKRRKTPLSRKRMLGIGLASILISLIGFGSVMAATEPASVRAQLAAEQAASDKTKAAQDQAAKDAAKPTTKSVTSTESIAFTSSTQNDSSLPSGQTQISIKGVDGVRTITYDATYVNGKETSRKQTNSTVTSQPVNQVTLVGTYVAPAPAPAPASSSSAAAPTDCPNGTYVNSAGNTVCSPYASPSTPAGATAQCVDGTYSFSQSRSGTCSHHGGVATWL